MTGREATPGAVLSTPTPAGVARAGASRARWDQLGRYVARRGWVHLVLLCGVGLFLFPFVWMVGMSLKTDEEATSPHLFPAVPTFRADSPIVRPAEEPAPPANVSTADWTPLLALLRDHARARINARPLPAGGDAVNASALRDAAATALVADLIEKLPESVWVQPSKEVLTKFNALATPEALDAALASQIGCLELRGLEVHALDARIFPCGTGADFVRQWHVESGNGQLLPAGDRGAYLRYHFASADDAPIVLQTAFPFPIEPADLHRLVLSMVGDDSWHRLDLTLDVAGQRWASAMTTYVAQYRPGSVVFQPPGFDDTTYQAHTWVPLHQTGDASSAGANAIVRLTLRPSSTPRAIYGKVERNYLRAFRSVPFWTYLTNSVLLVALQMVGSLFSTAFVAYAFARLRWPGRSLAFGILLATMMLPSQVTMIPGFVIWRTLGWYNTLNPLWIGSWFGVAFFIFLMTQFMKTIPRELEEAARIDGLNAVQTWWYIIVPLVKPTLAAIAIMVFMGAWNEFMGPLVMLRDQSKFPLSLGLFGMNVDQVGDFTLIMAGNMLMTLPVILIFFLFQRYFIEGVTVSGMKG